MFTNFIFLRSHHHFQCIFSNDERGPVCHARKTLFQLWQSIFWLHLWQHCCQQNAVPAILLLEGPNKRKSHGARSGLYGRWGSTVQPNLVTHSVVLRFACGLALSCCKKNVFFSNLVQAILAFNLINVLK